MLETSCFALRLRQARLKTGLSQKALGIKAGIDQFSASPRMNQYERGKHLPDILTVTHLAKAVGVPVPYFFAQDDLLAEILLLWGQMDEAGHAALMRAAVKILPPTDSVDSMPPSVSE